MSGTARRHLSRDSQDPGSSTASRVAEIRRLLHALGSRASADGRLERLLRRRDAAAVVSNLRALVELRLYWVSTDDHDEDWFVVAPDGARACEFFEAYEGYDPGDAAEELVAAIPAAQVEGVAREHLSLNTPLWSGDDPIEELVGRPNGWYPTQHPSRALIEGCGGEFVIVSAVHDDEEDDELARLRARVNEMLGGQTPRLVRFGARFYGEGDIVANSIASARAVGLA